MHQPYRTEQSPFIPYCMLLTVELSLHNIYWTSIRRGWGIPPEVSLSFFFYLLKIFLGVFPSSMRGSEGRGCCYNVVCRKALWAKIVKMGSTNKLALPCLNRHSTLLPALKCYDDKCDDDSFEFWLTAKQNLTDLLRYYIRFSSAQMICWM